MTINHRADIDGLRSLAIVPVMFFHAGVPGFSGGYIGVDVFFVISGFLIARIVQDGLDGGAFKLMEFYERRVRRIVPALFLMLAATTVAAVILMLPADFEAFSSSLIAAVFSVSNFFFLRTTGYFAPDAASQTLLHSWSLGVEAQYYVLFPLFMLLLWRFARRWLNAVVLVVLAGSLALSIIGMMRAPGFTFYMLPTRGWELLAGATVALGIVPPIRSLAARQALAGLGLLLVLAPVFLYSAQTPFPGLAALPPVLGTAILLHVVPGTFADRLLSHSAPVFIGLISYSLYLWHWPILTLAQYRLGFPVDGWLGLALLAPGVVLAYLSWKFVEQPFRRRSSVPGRVLWPSVVGGAALGLAVGGAGAASNGFPARFDAPILALADARNDFSPERERCFAMPGESSPLLRQCVSLPDAPARVTIWGDSHAVELASALGETLADETIAVEMLSASNCPPALGIVPLERPGCAALNGDILAHIESSPAQAVVLIARYSNDSYPDSAALFDGLEAAAQALVASGKTVVIAGAVPLPAAPVPRLLALGLAGGTAPEDMRLGAAAKAEALAIDARLEEVARRTGARFFSPASLLCKPDCILYEDASPLYFDDNHLSMAGARRVAGGLATILF